MKKTTNFQQLFDQAPNRRNGDSYKWNKYAKADADVIPAWIADMDFALPGPVIEAVQQRIHGTALGYSELTHELVETITNRLQDRHGWQVDPSWFVPLSGVVPGLYSFVSAVGEKGSAVIAQNPNYHHFFGAIEHGDRKQRLLSHNIVNGRWEIDFEQLRQFAAAGASSLLLCNPHNPVGRILSQHELQQIADICLAHNIVICSDEIHSDILLDEDKPHIPIATLSPEMECKTVTLISPSKTFNMPGVGGFALAIIPDPNIRKAFESQLHGLSTYPGALACEAALAAYRDCDDWHQALLGYLRDNRDLVEQRIATIPGLSMTHVEATFLAWINVKDLRLDKPASFFLDHGVALSDGNDMGDSDYLRLNFGCSRATLEEILDRIENAITIL